MKKNLLACLFIGGLMPCGEGGHCLSFCSARMALSLSLPKPAATTIRNGAMETPRTNWVAGVDGCRKGWAVVLRCSDGQQFDFRIIPYASELLHLSANPSIIAIDMPIGLLDQARTGGRDCDPIARRVLKGRTCCVFTPPVRAALPKTTFEDANRANRASSNLGMGISPHCFGLFEKLREVDDLMTPDLQRRIKEIHPELCFTALNQGRPLLESKHDDPGRKLRRDLLTSHGFGGLIDAALARWPKLEEDALDACAACWTAGRILQGVATRIPEQPVWGSRGLSMEMWW